MVEPEVIEKHTETIKTEVIRPSYWLITTSWFMAGVAIGMAMGVHLISNVIHTFVRLIR